jgi:16S rRNA (guanine527-N7)-methyltransferase
MLEAGLQSLGQSDPVVEALLRRRPDTGSLLGAYIDEIERFNPAYGLVSAKNREELVIRHILDSLAPLGIIARLRGEWNGTHALDTGGADRGDNGDNPYSLETACGGNNAHALNITNGGSNAHSSDIALDSNNTHSLNTGSGGNNTHSSNISATGNNAHSFNIADAGSGAGLPGIPLAIVLREASFTLIERMGRRAGFLRGALAVLGLSNVTVQEEHLEQMTRRLSASERFDLIVFRAFKALEGPVLKGLLGLLRPGGSLAAYKGRREKITAETAAAKDGGINPAEWETVPLQVPFLDEERHLVLIRKNTIEPSESPGSRRTFP